MRAERHEVLTWKWILALAAVAVAILVLYLPVFRLQLSGDDYQMAQFAHETWCHPRLLLAPLGQFFRPLTNWAFLLDRVLWGTHPAGYHATTLLLHLVAAVTLLAACWRLGFSLVTATAVAILWACSPFAEENAVWAASRFQDLLLIWWMLLFMIWPRKVRGEAWSGRRLAVAAAAVAGLVLSKESWVVTPGFALVFSLVGNGWVWRRAVKPALLLSLPAAAYVVIRFVMIPTTGGYFQPGLASFLKVPDLMAAFLWFREFRPMAFTLGWPEVLAVLIVAAAIAVGWSRRSAAAAVGAAFLLLPLAPTLLVPFLPQRYTAIPYAGFLLLVCGVGRAVFGKLPVRLLRTAGWAAVLVVLLVGAAGAAVVRADLVDWKRVSDAHARLLAEAREVAGELRLGEPVAVVRIERDNPLKVISMDPRGLYKLWYVRGQDPSGLIDAGALFDWVLKRPGVIVRRLEPRDLAKEQVGRVLFHRSGRFEWLPGRVPDLSRSVRDWQRRGFPVRVVEADLCRP